ncbi:hypothetical protein Scep_003835 [Stephania cephalantha]|uniref:Uncharacterized protein n=1 Tax=Stephania cephalantha TaxID=152367 RepID=A0AAP0KRD0_9MAGN
MSNPDTSSSTSSIVICLGLPARRGHSLAETMAEGRNNQNLHSSLEASNYPSSIVDPCDIESIVNDFCIHSYRCRVVLLPERICNATKDLCVFKAALVAGFRRDAVFAKMMANEQAKRQRTNEDDDVIEIDELTIDASFAYPSVL